jgi:hypothetical protein
LPKEFERRDEKLDGPREQGTRAAGFAVAHLFPSYFHLQLVCGLLAVASAVGLALSQTRRLHWLRAIILGLAYVTVLVGLPLEHEVNALRQPRYEWTDAFLRSHGRPEDAILRDEALYARAIFGKWHLYSVFVNLGTVAFVTAGMALAAWLPEGGRHERATEQGKVHGHEKQTKV